MSTIYEIVQQKVIRKLEETLKTGEKFHWIKPWSGGASYPCSYFTYYKPFNSLVNFILLEKGEYITFSRICALQKDNPQIYLKKGAKQCQVFQYFPVFLKDRKGNTVLDDNGEKIITSFKMHYIPEFHIEDVNGLTSHFKILHFDHTDTEATRLADTCIQEYCSRQEIEVKIEKNGNKAFFRPSEKLITLPEKSQFKSQYEYYSTVFHEIGHSTYELCGRELNGKNENRQGYAKEELIAEIMASLACAHFHIYDDSSMENNAAYIQNWLGSIREEPAYMIKAACDRAQKAFDTFLTMSRQPQIFHNAWEEAIPEILPQKKQKERKR